MDIGVSRSRVIMKEAVMNSRSTEATFEIIDRSIPITPESNAPTIRSSLLEAAHTIPYYFHPFSVLTVSSPPLFTHPKAIAQLFQINLTRPSKKPLEKPPANP